MGKINEKLEAVYGYIQSYIKDNNYPPSVREISAALKISSTSTVFYYLEKLEALGKISHTNTKSHRSITLLQAPQTAEALNIPLVGNVCAGDGIMAIENVESYYPIPSSMFSGDDLFLLNVKGDSMNGAGINDGDVLVVRKQNTADNGNIVVALKEDEATVKRLIITNNTAFLHPENEKYSDIPFNSISEINIQGIVIGFIRKF